MSDKEFKILVVGKTGVGKSALISALAQRPDASEEDFKEQSPTSPHGFPLPDSKVTLWDSPGFGTLEVPENKNYFSKVNFSSYDFYIVVSCSRVNEFEVKVIDRIAREGKGYLYVRTKMDQALKSEQRAHPRTFDQAKTLKKVRASVEGAISGASVFLVSCYDVEDLDFPRLKEEVLRAPVLPRPAPVIPREGGESEEEDDEEEEEEEMEEEPENPTGNDEDRDRGESQAESWYDWATNWCSLM